MMRAIRLTLWPPEKRERLRRRLGIAGCRLAAAFLVAALPLLLPKTLSAFYEALGISEIVWFVAVMAIGCLAFGAVFAALIVVSLHGTPAEARQGLLVGGLALVAMVGVLSVLPGVWTFSLELAELGTRLR
jgi:hypothetical protein